MELTVGHSTIMAPAGELATVVVGDNTIADATIVNGNSIVLTGKRLGSTNLIILDEAGHQILVSPLNVVPLGGAPKSEVRVIMGSTSVRTYVCGRQPGCNPLKDEETGLASAAAEPLGTCSEPDELAADGSRCGKPAVSVQPAADGNAQAEDKPVSSLTDPS